MAGSWPAAARPSADCVVLRFDCARAPASCGNSRFLSGVYNCASKGRIGVLVFRGSSIWILFGEVGLMEVGVRKVG